MDKVAFDSDWPRIPQYVAWEMAKTLFLQKQILEKYDVNNPERPAKSDEFMADLNAFFNKCEDTVSVLPEPVTKVLEAICQKTI